MKISDNPVDIEVPDKLTFFLDSDYVRYRVAYGGRASAKSWAAIRGLIVRVLMATIRVLCCREFQNSIGESVKHTLEENIELLGLGAYFTSTKDSLNCYNGSQFIFRGLHNNVAEIKSLENISIAYVEEAENVSEESWQTLIPTIRAENSEIWVVFNPKRADSATYQRFVVNPPENAIIRKINFDENPFCPAVMKEEAENLRKKNMALFRHIWLGECLTANENSLWKIDSMINPFRMKTAPANLDRIVVAVDPAVTKKESSDLTGIVIAGCKKLKGEMHYFVLDDRSLTGSPSEWAGAAVNAYKEYEADRIVAETNQGGDMVEQTIRNIDRRVSYRGVRATRGKIVRAEPIAELYERGLVHHIGDLPHLEDEMCSYCGFEQEKSPDRMDALVWALTELSQRGTGSAPIFA